jgi:predicted AAA+ superfamily ATPase
MGARRELYFFRDEQGLEVDFLVPGRSGTVRLIECKASKTITPAMAAPMLRLADALKKHRTANQEVDLRLVHEEPRAGSPTRAVAPGVRAQPWHEFLKER